MLFQHPTRLVLAIVLGLCAVPYASMAESSPQPVTTASSLPTWRGCIRNFALQHVKHTAWGVNHSQRDYALSVELAKAEGLNVDEDVLYAAAYLHDLGALDEYRKPGVDHAARSNELVEPILADCKFPLSKLDNVKAVITDHMYYNKPGATPETVVFRDADSLDFLGAIGAARILSLTTRHPWATDSAMALNTLTEFANDIPKGLQTKAAQKIGATRQAELRAFLEHLKTEVSAGEAF